MRTLQLLLLLLLTWAIIAPGCMTFRKTDSVMQERFAKKGVTLQTKTATVNGHHIHYAQTGADSLPTLVFVHGTPGSWDAFATYLEDSILRQQYRMISVDRPGFGYSDFGKVFPLQGQSDILSPLLKTWQNGKPAYLVGHSMGGPMVLKLAADNPGLYNGIVVVSGSIDPAEEKAEKWRPWLFKTPLNYLVPGAFRPSNEEQWYLKTDLVKLKEELPSIRIPVYFIHGDKDTWVPPGNVDYGKSQLKNAPAIGVLVFPGANHFIPWTRFNEIRNVLVSLPLADKSLHSTSSY